MLTSTSASLAGRSGYSLLSEYVPQAMVRNVPRRAARSLAARACQFALKRFSFTDWYQLGSLRLEWDAWRRLRGGFEGIVHMLWADSDLGFLDYAPRSTRQKLCCTFHHPASGLEQVIRSPHRLRNLDLIILMSATQKGYFLQHGVDENRIRVVHHGVDTGYFCQGQPPKNNRFAVLSVGSYLRNFELIRQIARLLLPCPSIEFHLLTARENHKLFEGLANVKCMAGIPDEDLLSEYQSASCFLVAVHESTANNALLEAMSCGVPIVAEDVGGVAEYVSGDCALLYPKLDARAASEAIMKIANSPSLQERMGAASRVRALEFDWARVAASMQSLYEQALAPR